GLLHAAFVRSTIAHARIESIDTSEAKTMPGVVAVYTSDDLQLPDVHGFVMLPPTMNRPPLAREKIRFVGDIVAVVVADSKGAAQDAAETVVVDYDPLPAVVDLESAGSSATLIHEGHGSNVANAMGTGPVEGVLDDADVVISQRIVNQRLAAVPMEPGGIVAIPGQPAGGLTFHAATQGPHGVRDEMAMYLGLDPAVVRGANPAVGGGFGAKSGMSCEQLIIGKCALALGRPVKWTETRSENMVGMAQGRGHVHRVELGLKRDGTITGMRVNTIADAGAYASIGAFLPFFTQMVASNTYAIPKIEFNWQAVLTNTTPIAAFRGAGRPEAIHLIERVLDMAADELGIDPVAIRRKNFIAPDAFPYMPTTGLGVAYDSGEYAKALDAALEHAGYDQLRAEQQARRERNDAKLLGIGVASYLEVSAPMVLTTEFGGVTIEDDGSATARVGTSAHGQGHETAFAQIISATLGIPFENVRVLHSDTAEVQRGGGTAGSRSMQIGGSALLTASEAVLAQAKDLAAHLLEASADDIVVGDGGLEVTGVPASRLAWSELAQAVKDPAKRPAGMEERLHHELDFTADGSSFPFGAHVAVVEVDRDTGRAELVRHIAVDDCGTIINPLLVAGQQHGGIAQGVAQALYEEVVYDDDGNPVTSNLMFYEMGSAAEFPSYETYNTVTPSPMNPLGAKGIGESATIGSTPAVHNAIIDALSHLGVRHFDMPCTPERVWQALHS
ncbi:MAG TPA: xanthine dehydrogenase family protein molybdopterin-binding subunit, partial [Acidimicrobiia bacterium]|nr:xanthine dehydrogenase family protein molybdopterin-binding subunit [Acidimicrobiia bacterium]